MNTLSNTYLHGILFKAKGEEDTEKTLLKERRGTVQMKH